jgi:hypothetical protein
MATTCNITSFCIFSGFSSYFVWISFRSGWIAIYRNLAFIALW